ncbi:MAG: RNA-binding transcriptional accessory protein [Deltaproteobacteria bacterium]|nr:RNA-binding transcriptional accessory protein [Deltaproteobacteria bacterium]
MSGSVIGKLAEELKVEEVHVKNAVELLFEEKCTIPFVTRYRKEKTGSMTELTLQQVRDRYTYMTELDTTKERYLKVIEEHAKAKPELAQKLPQLKEKIRQCLTKQELEDIYLPFKPKRKTRASVAREKGLDALLKTILERWAAVGDLRELARTYVKTEGVDPALAVADEEEALKGAADIFAEQINETAELRALARRISFETGMLSAKQNERANTEELKKTAEKYENYFSYRESIQRAPSHRVMAVRRGEAEKVLQVSIEVDAERIKDEILAAIKKEKRTETLPQDLARWVQEAVADAYKRLVAPAIETELRMDLRIRAEEEAIRVFASNLQSLLLLPPLPGKVVCGIDPGLRTGSKLAVVSATGALLEHRVIFPRFSEGDDPKNAQAERIFRELLERHKVDCIALGNGTGSREVDRFVLGVLRKEGLEHIKRYMVNESGASVYSTDQIAREEFPDLDPTIRSAVSIARRLQDPLAELVKIDPRSLGIGQYQHDCDASKLDKTLQETVGSCVNRVGVDMNTASFKLLSNVSGIGPGLAKSLVAYRDKQGGIRSRQELLQVSGLGPKIFEQAAGFLRTSLSENPLENSAVHPERYSIVERLAQDLQISLRDLIGKQELIKTIPLERYVNDEVGMPTLLDIVKELAKPGRDPRQDNTRLEFSNTLTSIHDLKVGMPLKGTVSNVTRFGCFVDIGVHQDGLVHISELPPQTGSDPSTAFSVGDILSVYVIGVDKIRNRISLSCRKPQTQMRAQGTEAPNVNGNVKPHHRQQSDSRRPQGNPSHPPRRQERGGYRGPKREEQHFSVEDLLNKFKSRS